MNLYRLAGGSMTVLGVVYGLAAAMTMDGGGDVLGMVLAALGLLLAGVMVLLVGKRLDEIKYDQDLANMINELDESGCGKDA